MNLPTISGPSAATNQTEKSSEEDGGRFRTHLATALSGAASVAASMAPAQPVAGVVAAGLGGVSRMLDGDSTQSEATIDDLETVLSETRSLNARYIELQTRMQMETQSFTAVSNILKSRHESAQTALNNIR